MCVHTNKKCVGGYSVGATPGPIPNPEAKPDSADGTALGRVWESKSPPTKNFINKHSVTTIGHGVLFAMPGTNNVLNRSTCVAT